LRPAVHLSGDTLIARESLMSLAVQFSLLAPDTGDPNTFCMQEVLGTVGPLSTANTGVAASSNPVALAASNDTTGLRRFIMFSRDSF